MVIVTIAPEQSLIAIQWVTSRSSQQMTPLTTGIQKARVALTVERIKPSQVLNHDPEAAFTRLDKHANTVTFLKSKFCSRPVTIDREHEARSNRSGVGISRRGC